MTIAAAYARKSNPNEASVERQLTECSQYAAREGLAVQYRYQDDGFSGAEFERRPGLTRLVATLPHPPFEVLLVVDRDRLGREQIETSYIVKKFLQSGVKIIETRSGQPVLLGTPTDKVVAAVSGFAAEMEREQARVRTRAALNAKAAAGYVTGGTTFGYDNVEHFTGKKRTHCTYAINPDQARIVVKIFELVAAGQGFKRIAHTLNADHCPAPRPSKNARAQGWCPSTVRAVLHRDLYQGVLIYGRTIKRDVFGQKQSSNKAEARRPADDWIRVEQPHLRIVPAELWREAHARLTQTRASYLRATGGRLEGRPISGTAAKYLLTSLAQCGLCGGTLSARAIFRHGTRQMTYECMTRRQKGRSVCANEYTVAQTDADALLLWLLEEKMLKPAVFRALVAERLQALRPDPAVTSAQRARLATALAQVTVEIANFVTAIGQGGDLPGLLEGLKSAEARRTQVTTELAHLDQVEALVRLDLPALEAQIKGQVQRWRQALTASPDAARQVARKLLSGRLVFTPATDALGPYYRVTGTGKLDGLVLPALIPRGYRAPSTNQSATGVVAPTGFEPVFQP